MKKNLNTGRLLRAALCITLSLLCSLLAGCGFHLQGETQLIAPLKRLYLETKDPYGYLARDLKQALTMSHVQLAASPCDATVILTILQDSTSQNLLSVNGTTQTRQYELKINVVFDITDTNHQILVGPQSLSESRVITIQSNQVLGSSNESSLFYQQMYRILSNAIMSRIASNEIANMVLDGLTKRC